MTDVVTILAPRPKIYFAGTTPTVVGTPGHLTPLPRTCLNRKVTPMRHATARGDALSCVILHFAPHAARHVRALEDITGTFPGRICFDVTTRQLTRISATRDTSLADMKAVAGAVKEFGNGGETALWSYITHELQIKPDELYFTVLFDDNKADKATCVFTRDGQVIYRPPHGRAV